MLKKFVFGYKTKYSKNEVEKFAIWQHFLISGKHGAYPFLIFVLCSSQIKNYIIIGWVSNFFLVGRWHFLCRKENVIRRKALVRITGQASKRNMGKKIFLRRFPFNRFLAKSLVVNKINLPWKSLSKICRSEATLDCSVGPSFIKLTYSTCMVWEARS